jgi:sensor domain CHASE-containing protein
MPCVALSLFPSQASVEAVYHPPMAKVAKATVAAFLEGPLAKNFILLNFVYKKKWQQQHLSELNARASKKMVVSGQRRC